MERDWATIPATPGENMMSKLDWAKRVAGVVSLMALVGVPACTQSQTIEDDVQSGVQAAKGWQLVWSDEFDQGGLPASNKWNYEVQGPGWVNNELQNYTGNRSENARVENGKLVIEARRDWYQGKEYSSARLKTAQKADWTYGRMEIRAKLPGGRGTWPAIWMMPTDCSKGWPTCGEIDIMEHVGYDPGRVHATVHTQWYNWPAGNQPTGTAFYGDATSNFHTYALEWFPDHLDAYVDNQKYFTYKNDGAGSGSWPFNKPFYLILNLAVGGDWGGAQGVDANSYPQRMEVEYVRVFKQVDVVDPPPTTTKATIPGRVQVEDFNTGGENVGYHDVDGANQGKKYRTSEGVDIGDSFDQGGGYSIGWTSPGEWLKYSVHINQAGTYEWKTRVASSGQGGSFHLEVDGQKVSPNVTVPNTNGWTNWVTLPGTSVNLPAGDHVLRLVMDQAGSSGSIGNLNYFDLNFKGSTGKTAFQKIEAESHDAQSGTQQETCSDSGGGKDVGYINNGDYLVFKGIDFGATGPTQVLTRVASGAGNGISGLVEFHLNGVNGPKIGDFAFGDTGGWQSWKTIPTNVSGAKGVADLYVVFKSGQPYDFCNLNWIQFQ
jgi:beta-glucanase (GH16 family)